MFIFDTAPTVFCSFKHSNNKPTSYVYCGQIHRCTTVKTVLTVHARSWLLSSNISDVACNVVSKNAMRSVVLSILTTSLQVTYTVDKYIVVQLSKQC